MTTKLSLGDNPLFGISHSGAKNEMESDEIALFLADAFNYHVDSMMITMHKGAADILRNSERHIVNSEKKVKLALVHPYPHTVNDIIASQGYIGIAKQLSIPKLAQFMYSNTKSVLFKGRLRSLVFLFMEFLSIELRSIPQTHFEVESVCIHNILTDLLVSIGRVDIIEEILSEVRFLGLKPVILTQNFVATRNALIETDVTICFSFNSLGYMVNPSLYEVTDAIKNHNGEIWAMQIAASGCSTISDFSRYCHKHDLEFQRIILGTTKLNRLEEAQKFLDLYS